MGCGKVLGLLLRKTNEKVATIFPDVKQPTKKKGKNKMFNKDKFKELAKERDNTDWDYKIDNI